MSVVFDRFCTGYDAWYTTPTGAFVDKVETDAAFSLLNPRAGMNVMDAGCGTGNFSVKLAQLGCHVTGIDISKNMLAVAREKITTLSGSIHFYEKSMYDLDFEDHTFDAVLSMAAFEFVHDAGAAYQQLKRVAKPGGVIVIGTIQKGGAWAELYSSPACADSAYAEAVFKTKEDLVSLDRNCVTDAAECLFVPPGLTEDQYTLAEEVNRKMQSAIGGFVCVKFQKT